MSKASSSNDQPSFEDAMRRLDEIVVGMEEGQPTLEEMISSYEEGVLLLKLCRQRLEGARRRVEIISGDLENGKATLQPFEEAGEGAETPDHAEKNRPSTRRRKPSETGGGDIRLF